MSVEELKTELEKVLDKALRSIKEIKNHEDLEKARVQFLGKKSQLNSFMKSLSTLDGNNKAAFGKIVNQAKNSLNLSFEEKKKSLKSKVNKKIDNFDVTMPSRQTSIGSLHPITKIMN